MRLTERLDRLRFKREIQQLEEHFLRQREVPSSPLDMSIEEQVQLFHENRARLGRGEPINLPVEREKRRHR